MILLLFALLTSGAHAQTPAAPPSAIDFIKTAIVNAEGDEAVSLAGKGYGAAYFPLRTLDLPWANTFDAGAGALFGGGKPEALLSARINLPQIANGIFGTSWFVSHTHGPELPTLFLGPAVKAEWPLNRWTWGKDIYFLLGIPFGSVFK